MGKLEPILTPKGQTVILDSDKQGVGEDADLFIEGLQGYTIKREALRKYSLIRKSTEDVPYCHLAMKFALSFYKLMGLETAESSFVFYEDRAGLSIKLPRVDSYNLLSFKDLGIANIFSGSYATLRDLEDYTKRFSNAEEAAGLVKWYCKLVILDYLVGRDFRLSSECETLVISNSLRPSAIWNVLGSFYKLSKGSDIINVENYPVMVKHMKQNFSLFLGSSTLTSMHILLGASEMLRETVQELIGLYHGVDMAEVTSSIPVSSEKELRYLKHLSAYVSQSVQVLEKDMKDCFIGIDLHVLISDSCLSHALPYVITYQVEDSVFMKAANLYYRIYNYDAPQILIVVNDSMFGTIWELDGIRVNTPVEFPCIDGRVSVYSNKYVYNDLPSFLKKRVPRKEARDIESCLEYLTNHIENSLDGYGVMKFTDFCRQQELNEHRLRAIY